MDKKPILYLSHCGSSIGGGEKQLSYLVTNIDRARYSPLVVCPDDGVFVEHLRNTNVPTVVLELPPWRKVKSIVTRRRATAKLGALAKTHNACLIHTSDSWFNPYLWSLKKRLKVPIVSHARNLLTPTQVQKYKFDRMDSIIAISEQSKTPLIQARVDARKIDVILNCVDLLVFQSVHRPAHPAEYVVGIVGRIEPFKCQKAFVEIAAKVAAQCKKVRFRIIGAALDTPVHRTYERQVRQLVAKYQLQDIIYFTGHRTDMPKAMQELDLLVTLSAGSVIAEAMAAGKPVIGTPIGSTADMIDHGVTGYVIPLDPMEKIVDKIIALAEDPIQSMRIGQAARKHAQEAFGIEAHVQKVQDIYERLLSKG
ncbi:MAG: glycosyltransferase family 4 protein [Candidatus Poribacteria bacterium]|nr:glycosyltransferase family 4 protein [Candidatus Poribacteria bacterium]